VERREYFWLLNAVQECCPASDPNAPEVEPARKPVGREAENTLKRLKEESLVGKFGFKIPDTVILRNGKPRKRFSMDAQGRIAVEKLNSSAQLLRILRRYVQLAQKRAALLPFCEAPRARSQLGRSPSPEGQKGFPAGGSCVIGGKVMSASRSEPSLRGSAKRPFQPRQQEMLPSRELRECAVLYYADGAVRYMTTAEAVKQMENVSRLPKEFWQHVVMLQTPVPVMGSRPDLATRYITYNFDAGSEGFEPQAPLPLVHRRSNSISHVDFARGQEAPIVAAVPRKINTGLATKRGRYGNGAGIISGRFEFVLDEADGSLWLINAEKLVVEHQKAQVEDSNSEEDDQIRYFKEDDFREFMQEQEKTWDGLKQRWECKEHTTGSDDEPPTFELVSRNAADRLAGVKSPDELLKYYQAENKMLRYYENLKKEEREANIIATSGQRAFGLCIWFKRWVRIHRDRRGRPSISNSLDASRSARPGSSSAQTRRSTGGRQVRSAGHHRQAS